MLQYCQRIFIGGGAVERKRRISGRLAKRDGR